MHRSRIQRPGALPPFRPPLEAQHPRGDVEGADHQAVDRVIGVAECRPGHDCAGEHRVAQPLRPVEAVQAPQERRQRRGHDQAEVPGRSRHHQRRPREGEPGQPGFGGGPAGDAAGEDEGHPRREDDGQQVDDVEGGDRAEPADERHGQQVQEERVVVLRQVDRPGGQREDVFGGEGVAVLDQRPVLEHPLVPDVHPGIAAGITGQVRGDVRQQRPGEHHRHQHITEHGGEVGDPRGTGHRQAWSR